MFKMKGLQTAINEPALFSKFKTYKIMKNFSFLLGKKIFLSLFFMVAFLLAHVSANNITQDPVKCSKDFSRKEAKTFFSDSACIFITWDSQTGECRICGYCNGSSFCTTCPCGDCGEAVGIVIGWLELSGCQ